MHESAKTGTLKMQIKKRNKDANKKPSENPQKVKFINSRAQYCCR